jgi:hypothetical protein|tara:strand:- start:430 stop:618 length:189 start_codon:yes stop_codon:yes gene_type:complete
MKKNKFVHLSPKMKNLVMAKWIKYYVSKGLSLEDAQYAAEWRSGRWKLSDRMRMVLDKVDKL